MSTTVDIDEEKTLGDYLNAVKRRKYALLVPALIIFTIMAIAAYVWPPTYRSTATILIEEQEIPKDLVRSTITSFASQQIQVIQQRIMTLQNIMNLVNKYSLLEPSELKRMSKSAIAADFRKAVDLDLVSAEVVDPQSGRPTRATIAFTLSYDHGDPSKAQKVANELVTLYLNENLRSRTEKTESTSDFLRSESESLSSKLRQLESNLANFKANNEGSLPELYQYNLNMLDRAELELQSINQQLGELQKQRVSLEADLARISPYAPSILETGERVLNDHDRLKALETEYRRKASIYSSLHPDVKRLKREIDTLKSQVGGTSYKDKLASLRAEQDKLSGLKTRYRSGHPEIVAQERVVSQLQNEVSQAAESGEGARNADTPDNPAYVMRDTNLKAILIEMDTLQQRKVDARQRIDRFEKLISKSPSVERQYNVLIRDIQTTQLKDREIKAKLMEAELASNLEQGRKGERFTLIQPPLLPENPIKPNRLLILIGGAILAMGAGVLSVIVLEMLDPSIRGERELFKATGLPPLVSIPYMRTDEKLRSIKRARITFVILFFVALILAVLVVHYFVKPLDVIWFMLQRRFGFSV